MLKKPLRLSGAKMCIEDADGEDIADCFLSTEAAEIVQAVNAFDALLAACESARDWALSMAGQSSHSPSMREELEQRAALLHMAITQANPPVSRPDVTTDEVRR